MTLDHAIVPAGNKRASLRATFAWTFAVISVLALVADAAGPFRSWPKMVFWTAFAAYNVLDPSSTFGRRWFWSVVWIVWAGFTVYALTTPVS